MSQVKDDTQVELAYAIASAHQGRGLARRAVLLALEHVRSAGVARATLSIGADNTASQQVAQATGFRPTDLPTFERHRKGRTLLLHVWERAL